MNTQPIEFEKRDATEDEVESLPHVVDSLPFVVWIALVAGGAERFTFYAVTTPWQNYMQYDQNSIAVPGALGLGQATASNLSSAFYAFTFLISVPFAILSDAWLGRYKTLCICFFLNFCGCLVLCVTSLPAVTEHSIKLFGLALAMVLLGLGTGGVKATITPFIGDQYPTMNPQLVTTKTGERVIADRMLTLQYIYNVFYWFTSIATLSLIASTYLEKDVGFWAAYLLPLCSVWIIVPLLFFWYKPLVKLPPQGNVLSQASKVIMCSAREGFRLDAAKPAYQAEKYRREVEWDDLFVSEIRRGLNACKVMACFVPYHLCNNQSVNNLITQAGQMRLDGVPNDTIKALNPVVCVLLGPVMQKLLYPTLRKLDIPFRPIARMAWAFITMSASMAFAAGIQKLIYTRGPCYEHPLACQASNGGSVPNDISVWVQTPVYFLLAFAEILGFTTLSEYSYSEAPKNMRTLVQALGQVSSGVGSALGMAVSPLSDDPKVMYLYTGLATVMAVCASIFWLVFRKYDRN
ncbi:oligopeptide transporter [Talaromyces proteolyticus]|uniref:Oligopeptide transporter n=1 Tax=Talaromyces proteolyticus TaxID=1131652 RepID=A0AAD4KJX8_9EURO|nr:oligopeptide transporter [Talaromyces proteolyticus]KAH8692743.1 oligopeptide transporter [Talaromyces proteolyticus]